MKRSTFVIFGLVVLLLGVGVPAWAYTHQGSQSSSPDEVAASLQPGKDLFVTNCGACLGKGVAGAAIGHEQVLSGLQAGRDLLRG